jgi:Rrf2 family iron-sulfur cluster assembly transcriptional regulator
MRLTSKGRYAVRAMLDLTFHSSGNPVRLQEISSRQAISLHYLEQLFRKLRTGRVVKSVRGPGGGYVLARSMDEISVKDILECVGENINPAKDISGLPSSGVEVKANEGETTKIDTVEFQLTRGFFENLGILMQEYLTTTTLGDLSRKSREMNTSAMNNSATNMETINNAANGGTNTVETANNETASVIRPSLGEMNQ